MPSWLRAKDAPKNLRAGDAPKSIYLLSKHYFIIIL
jgi:hypothetical protein